MFTGIDEVDWTSLRHAYGSARDVPGLLRGLASAETAERAAALDGMYGAVHHEGNVYDSTLACVPFLLALAADERVRERGGLVDLLVSIGECASAEGVAARAGVVVRAGAAVRAGAEVFVRLTGDPDAGVRRAAATAVVRFLDEPARVLALLRERLTVERNDRLVIALVENLGHFARRHPQQAARAVELLAALSGPPHGPGPRLAALGQLASCAPERLPADLVPTVLGLVGERSAQHPCRPGAAGASGVHSLVDRLRRLRPSDEEGTRLLRTLHTALDDRLPDRITLLHGQLTSPAPTDRCNAVLLAAALFREWRGDHSATVALIAEQLRPEEHEDRGRLRDTAVSVLADLFALAAPAADRLHALVASHPDEWIRRWRPEAPLLAGPLHALARSGDPRAVPVLAEVLAEPVVPRDLGAAVADLGAPAAPLAPALRRALAAVPLGSPDTATPLLSALRALRDTESLPEVVRVLDAARRAARTGHGDRPLRAAIETLAAFGAGAREAVPVLRGLLDGEHALAAADALWAVEGDTSAVLHVLLRELTHEDHWRRTLAARSLELLGPAAHPALPALRRAIETGSAAERAAAGCAVCRITGEVEPAVGGALRSAWAERPRTRTAIATCLTALGPTAAPLRDLAATELAGPRRHTARPGGHGSHDIPRDEELLRVCRGVVEGT
ncbi:HEAT repeat domain-containing protein [Streptomyces sp. NBC_01235]|uniref:HEAT repeat domain-containing protein n=1 Tax=Streptomyces sp. NBC_01235 TaxID=2903788 RepID=UPI002E13B570|nr:HEAT repeat domain-containing protein [Streptomyces sp. NBC_01235]